MTAQNYKRQGPYQYLIFCVINEYLTQDMAFAYDYRVLSITIFITAKKF